MRFLFIYFLGVFVRLVNLYPKQIQDRSEAFLSHMFRLPFRSTFHCLLLAADNMLPSTTQHTT